MPAEPVPPQLAVDGHRAHGATLAAAALVVALERGGVVAGHRLVGDLGEARTVAHGRVAQHDPLARVRRVADDRRRRRAPTAAAAGGAAAAAGRLLVGRGLLLRRARGSSVRGLLHVLDEPAEGRVARLEAHDRRAGLGGPVLEIREHVGDVASDGVVRRGADVDEDGAVGAPRADLRHVSGRRLDRVDEALDVEGGAPELCVAGQEEGGERAARRRGLRGTELAARERRRRADGARSRRCQQWSEQQRRRQHVCRRCAAHNRPRRDGLPRCRLWARTRSCCDLQL